MNGHAAEAYSGQLLTHHDISLRAFAVLHNGLSGLLPALVLKAGYRLSADLIRRSVAGQSSLDRQCRLRIVGASRSALPSRLTRSAPGSTGNRAFLRERTEPPGARQGKCASSPRMRIVVHLNPREARRGNRAAAVTLGNRAIPRKDAECHSSPIPSTKPNPSNASKPQPDRYR